MTDNTSLLDELMNEAENVWATSAKEISENAPEHAEWWDGKSGSVAGEVVKVWSRDSYDGKRVNPVVDLKTATGVVHVEAKHAVLRSELTKAAPRPGDHLNIVNKGKKKGANYYLFDVEHTPHGDKVADDNPQF